MFGRMRSTNRSSPSRSDSWARFDGIRLEVLSELLVHPSLEQGFPWNSTELEHSDLSQDWSERGSIFLKYKNNR
jgi:hypothetical protein